MKISQRAQSVPASMTIAVTERAKALKAQGVDVVGFGAGEPDFDTPDYIKNAGIEAIKSGKTKYTPDELRALAKVLERSNIYVMSDEIYERLIYGETQFVSFAALSEDAFKRTITLNGLSKAFSMTGWRLGYTAGPLDVIKAMGRLQSHMTSNPVTFAQYAAVKALGPQADEAIETMRIEFEKRAKVMADRLNSMEGVECAPATGAFYCFPDVSAHYGRSIKGVKIANSMDFSQALLEQASVAVVPGVAFGCDNNVRLSFACSLEQINKGLDRLEQWLKK
jgi:aspartate aminotransferase